MSQSVNTRIDHYAVLGLSRSATVEDIRAAFRRLAKTEHPDVAVDKVLATERFKAINEAYRVLININHRFLYDLATAPLGAIERPKPSTPPPAPPRPAQAAELRVLPSELDLMRHGGWGYSRKGNYFFRLSCGETVTIFQRRTGRHVGEWSYVYGDGQFYTGVRPLWTWEDARDKVCRELTKYVRH